MLLHGRIGQWEEPRVVQPRDLLICWCQPTTTLKEEYCANNGTLLIKFTLWVCQSWKYLNDFLGCCGQISAPNVNSIWLIYLIKLQNLVLLDQDFDTILSFLIVFVFTILLSLFLHKKRKNIVYIIYINKNHLKEYLHRLLNIRKRNKSKWS